MADFKNYRDHSRINYGNSTGAATLEQINSGSLQRIADATEAMAKNYTAMQEDRDRYKRWYEDQRAITLRLSRRITAFRGVITRMKKRKEV